MKRLLSLFLFLLMLPAMPAYADGTDTWYALIDNPTLTDRLNLRPSPAASDSTLGRYYNGTVVTVLEKGDAWSQVVIDGLASGYMMNEYLDFYREPESYFLGREMQGREAYIFRGRLKANSMLYDHPDLQSAYAATRREEEIMILGDVNDDFLHVHISTNYLGEQSCYVRRQDIASRYLYGMAVVVSDSPERRLNLRSDCQTDARVIGKFYAGTVVSVHETKNGFARVTVLGEGRNYSPVDAEEEGGFLQGWMQLDYLRFGNRADFIGTENHLPIAEVSAQSAKVLDVHQNPIGTLDKGMRMLVLGTVNTGTYFKDEHLLIDTGDSHPMLIRADQIKVLAGVHTPGGMPVMGYGVLQPADPKTAESGALGVYATCDLDHYSDCLGINDTVAILSVGEGWAQVKSRSTEGYVPIQWLDIYLLPNCLGNSMGGDGAYETGFDMDAGFYTFDCRAGGSLTVTYSDGSTRTLGGDAGKYTLFVPMGATLTIENGSIAPMALDTKMYTAAQPAYATTGAYLYDEPQFSGSGRYLVGEHLESGAYWDYILEPLDPHQPAWYTVSTPSADSEGTAPKRVDISPSDPYVTVNFTEGQLVEFHNLTVTVHYGNG